MKINHIYIKIFLTLGLFFLAEVSMGAVERRNEEITTIKINNDSLIAEGTEKKSFKTDNVFYVDEWIKGWFIRIDRNQDHQIDSHEFVNAMETLGIEKNYLKIFDTSNKNPDGAINLKEFKSFVDTTDIFSANDLAKVAAANTVTTDAESLDVVKLLAGVVAISLLMAAFRLM